ncbi:PIN domain-containing protein [Candidatus Pacearchaeota archaeon]|nr:PIN domain-containing protein [Candidatus Pacearchaeota archaeon]
MQRYYLDTSIWLDLFEDRGKNSEKVLEFIKKMIENNSLIHYSEANIKELKHLGYGFNEVTALFIPIRSIIRKIHICEDEINMAKKIALQRNVPKIDALHAILSRNNEAQLISRDRHFEKLKDIAITKKPEEIT